jgi:hypothetical protein
MERYVQEFNLSVHCVYEYSTIQGIEPNIERLARKHKDQIEDIKAKCEYSKKKLELHFENDLADKVQSFQQTEQQSNAWINQRNEFVAIFAREQDEHALHVKKLSDKLVKEENSIKKLHSLQLETLVKDNVVALSKLQSSTSAKELANSLLAKKKDRQRELEDSLTRACRDTSKKNEWEASWIQASTTRVEMNHSKMVDELTAWRSSEIDDLIRRSVVDEMHR